MPYISATSYLAICPVREFPNSCRNSTVDAGNSMNPLLTDIPDDFLRGARRLDNGITLSYELILFARVPRYKNRKNVLILLTKFILSSVVGVFGQSLPEHLLCCLTLCWCVVAIGLITYCSSDACRLEALELSSAGIVLFS